MKPSIQYLRHADIDKASWDRCMDHAPNGLIYGYYDYLTQMADNWDALVMNDYEAVMPLPWKKKYGVYYLYQPLLTAQLGLFGKDLNAVLLEQFFSVIPSRFRLWEFSLNHKNLFSLKKFPLYERNNFILDLNKDYKSLEEGYRDNIRRNIRKAKSLGCYAQDNIPVTDIIRLAGHQNEDNKELNRFIPLYEQLKDKNRAKAYGIYSGSHQLLASAAFLFSHRRAYYILVGNHPNGRTLGASHYLVDAFIKDHASHDLLLDFEGSDLRNLAFFYSGFGSREEKYAAIQYNRLPWYLKLFK